MYSLFSCRPTDLQTGHVAMPVPTVTQNRKSRLSMSSQAIIDPTMRSLALLALMLASTVAVVSGGIYPEEHWSNSIKLTEENFDDVVQVRMNESNHHALKNFQHNFYSDAE